MSNIRDYIFEHLDNLGELERTELKYLSNNVEEFYSEPSEHNSLILNEKAFLQLSHLFRLISFDDFPKEFNLTNVKIKYINGKIRLINKYKQLCYEEDDVLVITPLLIEVDSKTFINSQIDILNTYNKEDRWKYPLYDIKEYDSCKNYLCKNKCAISIDNGDIVNFIKATNMKSI